MRDEAERKKNGAEAADELFSGVEEAEIEGEARGVSDCRGDKSGVAHVDS
jgi:hypothetical protein